MGQESGGALLADSDSGSGNFCGCSQSVELEESWAQAGESGCVAGPWLGACL